MDPSKLQLGLYGATFLLKGKQTNYLYLLRLANQLELRYCADSN